MFCYQCEQAFNGKGCTTRGVCGKDDETAALQDLLVHAVKGISMFAHRARTLGQKENETDVFVIDALFTTVTNVNFDPARLRKLLGRANEVRAQASRLYEEGCRSTGRTPEALEGPAIWDIIKALADPQQAAKDVAIRSRSEKLGEDVTSLHELILYGLKGMAAYASHARILGQEDDGVYAFFHETLDYLALDPADVTGLTGWALRCGEVNITVMELLDRAHTKAYGHPEPTKVRVTPVQGKAILVSGHDLADLEELLEQTADRGITIYTHGEMLPAHAYPGLKKHRHLAGNYGGAWQDQQKEFAEFPGAILMTTNCIQKPRSSYKGRIFTTGLVAWPGVTHVKKSDFTAVIEAALEADGFEKSVEEKTITVGFGHNAVLGAAGTVIDAVKSGALRHFFVVGGCDGAKPGRNYYTEFAQAVPEDCVILTLACGKYRFNDLEFGEIRGIPRLLDVGQCNDAYSAVKIAQVLAEAFETDVNGLPLSFVLSWYEQKAVCILLSLLFLGVRGIRIGPSLPAFVSANVLNVLVENFDISPITTVEEDMKALLG